MRMAIVLSLLCLVGLLTVGSGSHLTGVVVDDAVSARLYGGDDCSHNFKSVSAGGTVYCSDCDPSDAIRKKDDGGSYKQGKTNCRSDGNCTYPKNENCGGL